MILTFGQLRHEWIVAGGPPREADVAAAIAMAESHGRMSAVNTSDPYGGSFCAWQINGVHPFVSSALLRDPYLCATAAVYVHHKSGWGAWSTYQYGRYRAFLPRTSAFASSPRVRAARHASAPHAGRKGHVRHVPIHGSHAAPGGLLGDLALTLFCLASLLLVMRATALALDWSLRGVEAKVEACRRLGRRRRRREQAALGRRTRRRLQLA